MKTQLAVSVETDGKHCGDCAVVGVDGSGRYSRICEVFAASLQEDRDDPGRRPLRCTACLRAEAEMARILSGEGGAPSLARRR